MVGAFICEIFATTMTTVKYGVLSDDHILSSPGSFNFPDVHLSDLMHEKISSHGDKILFIEGKTGQKYSAAAIRRMSEQICSMLQQLDLHEEDIVFCVCPDTVLYAVTIIAIQFVGLVYSGSYWTVPKREIQFQAQTLAAKVMICSAQNLDDIIEIAEEVTSVQCVLVLDPLPRARIAGFGKSIFSVCDFLSDSSCAIPKSGIPVKIVKSPKLALCCIMLSSGSTGMPKGVRVTHANAIAMCYSQMRSLEIERHVEAGTVGFAHTVGLTLIRLVVLSGICVVVQDNFQLENFLQTVQTYACTNAWLSPSELTQLAKSPLLSDYDISSLREVKVGGSTIPAPVIKKFNLRTQGRAKITGVYGLTECGDLTHVPAECMDPKTVGALLPGHQLKIVNKKEAGDAGLPPFEVGEIFVRGPQLAPGYHRCQEADLENYTAEGWFKSGDMGFVSDCGLVYVIGRYKEVIKGDGEQVAPAELESLILTHDSVAEAAVIGIPDEEHCEVPKAFVVLREIGRKVSVTEILDFVNSQVADYKKIRGGIELMSSLPKMSIGKIDRMALKRRPRSPNDSIML